MRTAAPTMLSLLFHGLVFLGLGALPARAEEHQVTAYRALFTGMESAWPNLEGRSCRGSLNEAEDGWAQMREANRALPEMQKLHASMALWERRAKAAAAKDRALRAMLRGHQAGAGEKGSPEAAKEHYALAVEAWDEALRLAPEMKDQSVAAESAHGGALVTGVTGGANRTAAVWRALAAEKLAER